MPYVEVTLTAGTPRPEVCACGTSVLIVDLHTVTHRGVTRLCSVVLEVVARIPHRCGDR